MTEQNSKITLVLDLIDVMPNKTANTRTALKTMFNVDIAPIQSDSKMERLFSVTGTGSNLHNFIGKFVLSNPRTRNRPYNEVINEYV